MDIVLYKGVDISGGPL